MIYIKIPQDRIGALIGPKGATKKQLIERSGLQIEVDGEQNEVAIHDEAETADPLMVMKMQNIVRAIARGFSPERASRLFSDDAYFELLDMYDYIGKQKSHVRRITSRIIGSEGKTRRIMEEQTGCAITVKGHTVGIIGEIGPLGDAKHAIEMILRGAEHSSVYKFLEKKRRETNKANRELW
ncbi:MAG: KH domain-containing protein [Thermoplasmatota archaeon]